MFQRKRLCCPSSSAWGPNGAAEPANGRILGDILAARFAIMVIQKNERGFRHGEANAGASATLTVQVVEASVTLSPTSGIGYVGGSNLESTITTNEIPHNQWGIYFTGRKPIPVYIFDKGI